MPDRLAAVLALGEIEVPGALQFLERNCRGFAPATIRIATGLAGDRAAENSIAPHCRRSRQPAQGKLAKDARPDRRRWRSSRRHRTLRVVRRGIKLLDPACSTHAGCSARRKPSRSCVPALRCAIRRRARSEAAIATLRRASSRRRQVLVRNAVWAVRSAEAPVRPCPNVTRWIARTRTRRPATSVATRHIRRMGRSFNTALHGATRAFASLSGRERSWSKKALDGLTRPSRLEILTLKRLGSKPAPSRASSHLHQPDAVFGSTSTTTRASRRSCRCSRSAGVGVAAPCLASCPATGWFSCRRCRRPRRARGGRTLPSMCSERLQSRRSVTLVEVGPPSGVAERRQTSVNAREGNGEAHVQPALVAAEDEGRHQLGPRGPRRGPLGRRSKRVVQGIVDQILNEETSLLGPDDDPRLRRATRFTHSVKRLHLLGGPRPATWPGQASTVRSRTRGAAARCRQVARSARGAQQARAVE